MKTIPKFTRHPAVWLVLSALALPIGQLSALAQDNAPVPVSPKAAANRANHVRVAEARLAQGAPPVPPEPFAVAPEPSRRNRPSPLNPPTSATPGRSGKANCGGPRPRSAAP